MRRELSPRGLVAVAVLLSVLSACRPPSPRPLPSPDAAPPVVQPVAAPLPPPDLLFQMIPSLTIHATTTLEVRRGASVVTLRDEKEVRRLPAGDFDVSIRRVHQGSEAGDTEESFHAIRLGKEYFTRGSGGPFVQWDDALDEPATTLNAVAGEPRALLAFLTPCLRDHSTPDEVSWTSSKADCSLSSAPGAAPMTATLREASARLRREGDRPLHLEIHARLDVASGGHQAAVTLRHEAAWAPLPDGERIEPPKDPISSRRERPVRMVATILSGLVTEWGPGAPPSLKSGSSAPGGSPPAKAGKPSPSAGSIEE